MAATAGIAIVVPVIADIAEGIIVIREFILGRDSVAIVISAADDSTVFVGAGAADIVSDVIADCEGIGTIAEGATTAAMVGTTAPKDVS